MKILKFIISAGLVLGLGGLICSCDEKPKGEEGLTPTVTVEAIPSLSTTSSVTFQLNSENATAVSYLRISSLDEVPSANAILSVGTAVELPGGQITIENLAPSSTYYVAAAAANGDLFSEVATVELSTAKTECTIMIAAQNASSSAISYRAEASDETTPYYVCALKAADYASASDEELFIAAMEAADIASGSEDVSTWLSSRLRTGISTGTISSLETDTQYLLLAMGLDLSNLSLTTSVAKAEAATTDGSENSLRFELSVSNITATSARVVVTPSDLQAQYVFLCQPSSSYPGIGPDNPLALAEEYVARQGFYLDAGMGLYQGISDYEISLSSDTEYYLFAFGYIPQLGISSPCELYVFTSGHGVNADEFEAEVTYTAITAHRVDFGIYPADVEGMESIYYYPICQPTASYNFAEAQDIVRTLIEETRDQNLSINPGYTLSDATSSICFRGDYGYFGFSGLSADTEYTIIVVAVSNDGVPSDKEVTSTFRTEIEQVSTATFTNELVGIYDGAAAIEAGLFEGQESLMRGNAIAVFRLTASADAAHCYYNTATVGNHTDPNEEYWTDDDLLSTIINNPFTREVAANTTYLYVPYLYEDKTYNDYTFFTFASDANGIYGPFCRTYVCARTTEVDPIQELVDLINAQASTSAKSLLQLTTPAPIEESITLSLQ